MVTPEHHGLADLLVEMRTGRHHIALVVDEHGTVVGVVTLEDLLEELIGDFDDESDRRLGLPDGSYRVNGTLRPDQFAECTGQFLPDGDWQTVAGYVIDVVDEIPSVGDRIGTDIGEFEVLAMDGFAIDALRVRINAADRMPD